VTLIYPAIVGTAVNLAAIGGSSTGIFSIPATVTVPAGATQVSFAIAVQGDPGPAPQTWTIVASLASTVGTTSTAQALLTITGSQGIASVSINYPVVGAQYGTNGQVVTVINGVAVSPVLKITLSSPAQATTPAIYLSVTGAQLGVSLPPTVTAPVNQSQVTAPITVTKIPSGTATYNITAALTSGGAVSTMSATFTVTNAT
jgi:hypothetical protein